MSREVVSARDSKMNVVRKFECVHGEWSRLGNRGLFPERWLDMRAVPRIGIRAVVKRVLLQDRSFR